MASSTKLSGLHRRMPVVFGPFPGPRQSFAGHRRDGSQSTSVEAFITFRTPQSTIADLLPPGFSFQQTVFATAPNAEAFVTVAAKRLDQLEWLGGRGYNLYSYYIHGVQYKSRDGKTYKGTFLPVLWEDMADPVISGREELGFPKLFADLPITQTEDSYSMNCSWQGAQFADFHLAGLQETEETSGQLAPPEAGVEEGLFLYRSIPTTGEPGVAELEYPVFVDYAAEGEIQPAKVVMKFIGTDAKFTWYPRDWKSLPTLHHVVSRLAEVPVSGIVRSGVIEKVGMADISSARRIDKPVSASKL